MWVQGYRQYYSVHIPRQVARVYHAPVSREYVKNADLEYMENVRIWGISCNGIPPKRVSDIRAAYAKDANMKDITRWYPPMT